MMLYDACHNRLALFQKEATPEFWDQQWSIEDLKRKVGSGKTYHFLKRFTRRYVPAGGRILEGGCGIGQVVYYLRTLGYESYGVDFAKETIESTRKLFPSLPLSVQDVRSMNFQDNYFDGYWSLGVIEHFWNGYDDIIKEARRVIKPGGYLFLTFPVMSPLRKLKARLGFYKELDHAANHDNFYEFMLDKRRVVSHLSTYGFLTVRTYSYDALKGLKDEFKVLKPFLQKLYDSRGFVARAIRFAMTFFLAQLAGHMMLLVLKKKE